MRTAGLPSFRKLWGKVHEDLVAGNYTMVIDNRIFYNSIVCEDFYKIFENLILRDSKDQRALFCRPVAALGGKTISFR